MKREGTKIEESKKMKEMREKQVRKEKRQAKARVKEQKKQEDQPKRKFPCTTVGCVMQFSNKHLLDQHLLSRRCCTNGNAFRAPKSPQAPTRYAGLSGKPLYAKIMEDLVNDPNFVCYGVAAAECTIIEEGRSTAAWGQVADARRLKSKTPQNIIEAIKGMTELGM